MAVPHAQPNEVIDVRPLDAALGTSRTNTLVKTSALELIRIVLPAGKQIPTHQVAGEITVQCLEGKLAFDAGGKRHELSAGQLVVLPGNCPHALLGIVDASVLVTILLTK